jgi:hypothetical protein
MNPERRLSRRQAPAASPTCTDTADRSEPHTWPSGRTVSSLGGSGGGGFHLRLIGPAASTARLTGAGYQLLFWDICQTPAKKSNALTPTTNHHVIVNANSAARLSVKR